MEGNRHAQQMLADVLEVCDRKWQGSARFRGAV